MAAIFKMDPNQEKDDLEVIIDDSDDESMSVDDFIRQLEEKEKDLHITLETTIIEIEQGFDDVNPTEFIKAASPSPTDQESPVIKSIEPIADNAATTAGVSQEEISDMESKLDELSGTIAKMREERADILTNSQRRAKDFENFKARTERERSEIRDAQASDLAARILPAMDNLNRALDAAALMSHERSPEFEQFYQGIVLVNRQVVEIFEGMGIMPIKTVGEMFDPHLHEAVATEESEENPPNTIAEELLRGYYIGDRVIRHSLVKVFVTPPSSTPVEEETALSFDDEIEDEEDAELLKASTELPDPEPIHSDEIPDITESEPTVPLEEEESDDLLN